MTTDNKFSQEYSEGSFWEKVKNYGKNAGCKVIYTGLLLFYSLKSPDTPKWAKGVIIGALGYFISFIDAIPDLAPVVGYTDDLGVLVAAVATVAAYIDDSVKKSAKNKLHEWFDDECSPEIDDMFEL